jgi:hypothetical protein
MTTTGDDLNLRYKRTNFTVRPAGVGYLWSLSISGEMPILETFPAQWDAIHHAMDRIRANLLARQLVTG